MSSLNYTSHSDEHFDRIHYYSPLIPPVKPRKKELNTELKIALIGSDRLYNGFRFEADVFLLTEENWKEALKYLEFDFLLVESCLESTTGHWEYAQIEGSEKNQKLKNLVEFAKEKSIPTVYWFTHDHVYHDNYKIISSIFDYVFCADTEEVILLEKEGIDAIILPPAVQPVLFNPFREYAYYDALNINLLFDGWADIYRFGDQLMVLEELKIYGLKIIDSKKEIFHKKISYIPELADVVLGSVSNITRQTLLKYSKNVVSFDNSLLTKTSQQWDALEVAASRVVQLHRGIFEVNDIRKNIVVENKTDPDIIQKLIHFEENELFREKLAHKAWRNVNLQHTYNHRLVSICEKLKITHNNKKEKKASLITPTYRVDYIEKVIRTFESQTYKNKELNIIYNGFDEIPPDILNNIQKNVSITISSLHPETSVGECLNYGNAISKGDYCFRIDDDDDYGPQYILDMMLHLSAVESNYFGRFPIYYYLESDGKIHKRKRAAKQLVIVPANILRKEEFRISGNTMSAKRFFLLRNKYPSKSFNAADTSLQLNVAHNIREALVMDNLNTIINRRADESSHTWRLGREEFLEVTEYIRDDINI